MEPLRIPLAVEISSRDSSAGKDALMTNCHAERGADGRLRAVKRPGLVTYSALGAGCGQGMGALSALYAVRGDQLIQVTTDTNVYANGVTWSAATNSPPWVSFNSSSNTYYSKLPAQIVTMGGYLYAIPQSDVTADGVPHVYRSSDGINWTDLGARPYSGTYYARFAGGFTVFNNKLWLLGGRSGGAFHNEVWSSSDGITWVQQATPPWGPRAFMGVAVLGNKLFVIGGIGSNAGETYGTNDVWYTTDGTTWTSTTTAAPWSKRYGHACTTFSAKLWIVGGEYSNTTAYTDVWSSTDGITWTQATTTGPANVSSASGAAGIGPTAISYNNLLWVIGGSTSGQVYNSADGITWSLVTGTAGFADAWFANLCAAAIFNNTIWISGHRSASTPYTFPIWYATTTVPAGTTYTLPTDGAVSIPWTKVSAAAGFTNRQDHTMLDFGGKMWVIGGNQGNITDSPLVFYNDVWSSADGITWTQVTAAAPWAARSGHTAVVYNSRMWILGGVSATSFLNDCWSSADGITWTQEPTGPWPGRHGHGSVVFGGKIWVISGRHIATASLNDVWSYDGASWTQSSTPPEWAARSYFYPAVFNNKMWVFGGYDDVTPYLNDVWSSADGNTWTKVASECSWAPRHGFVSFVINSKLYIMGGYDGIVWRPDIWATTDGIVWTEVLSSPSFLGRAFHDAVVSVGGKVWMTGGRTGMNTFRNDVWSSTVVETAAAGSGGTTCVPYEFSQTLNGNYLVFKNTERCFYYSYINTSGTLKRVVDSNYPSVTVPGIVYLDGTFYVMTPTGDIYGSAIENPAAWSALNFINASAEPDAGVALARQNNYLVALGTRTVEFFYDAGNAVGSPLGKVQYQLLKIGCAHAGSVRNVDDFLVFVAQSGERGRSVVALEGFSPKVISNAFIDRILDADSMAPGGSVVSFSMRVSGHLLYILTLKATGITLVYDFTTGQWHRWTSRVPATPMSVTSTTVTGGVATVVCTAHGNADGDPVTMAGYSNAALNGVFNITYIDANSFSFLTTAPDGVY